MLLKGNCLYLGLGYTKGLLQHIQNMTTLKLLYIINATSRVPSRIAQHLQIYNKS